MQLNKISLQFTFDDYEKVAYSLPVPTYRRTLSKHNHQGYVCITYELKHSITSSKQFKWIANIKQSMKHNIKADFDFVESINSDEVNNKKYSLEELSQYFKSINTTYPKILFAQNKKEIYQRLCIYGKNLYYCKMLSIEMVMFASIKMNDLLNKPCTYKELLNMSNRAYKYILDNQKSLKQKLTPYELKRAYKRGGETRGNQMKKQQQKNKRMILKLISDGNYNKPNGKPNITAISKESNLSRVTITKIIKEALFSFLPLFFISYMYLNSHVISNGYKYHNAIAYFTLLTESRYIVRFRV